MSTSVLEYNSVLRNIASEMDYNTLLYYKRSFYNVATRLDEKLHVLLGSRYDVYRFEMNMSTSGDVLLNMCTILSACCRDKSIKQDKVILKQVKEEIEVYTQLLYSYQSGVVYKEDYEEGSEYEGSEYEGSVIVNNIHKNSTSDSLPNHASESDNESNESECGSVIMHSHKDSIDMIGNTAEDDHNTCATETVSTDTSTGLRSRATIMPRYQRLSSTDALAALQSKYKKEPVSDNINNDSTDDTSNNMNTTPVLIESLRMRRQRQQQQQQQILSILPLETEFSSSMDFNDMNLTPMTLSTDLSDNLQDIDLPLANTCKSELVQLLHSIQYCSVSNTHHTSAFYPTLLRYSLTPLYTPIANSFNPRQGRRERTQTAKVRARSTSLLSKPCEAVMNSPDVHVYTNFIQYRCHASQEYPSCESNKYTGMIHAVYKGSTLLLDTMNPNPQVPKAPQVYASLYVAPKHVDAFRTTGYYAQLMKKPTKTCVQSFTSPTKSLTFGTVQQCDVPQTQQDFPRYEDEDYYVTDNEDEDYEEEDFDDYGMYSNTQYEQIDYEEEEYNDVIIHSQ